jgi:hypothetical protein
MLCVGAYARTTVVVLTSTFRLRVQHWRSLWMRPSQRRTAPHNEEACRVQQSVMARGWLRSGNCPEDGYVN